MKIAVTGASGFVGLNLLPYLVANGCSVIAIRRKADGIPAFDTADLDRDVSGIIHLAGKAHDLKEVAKPEDYTQANVELTKSIYDHFLVSSPEVFIFLSSVKAVADEVAGSLSEDAEPHPRTVYGKTKLQAEAYILGMPRSQGKRVYILRPCMIHGPGNKGNLNLLYRLVRAGIPWPLGSFNNHRSFCSIENLSFVIKELLFNKNIPSGVYNIADDEPLGTNELVRLIAASMGKKGRSWKIPRAVIQMLARAGDLVKLPLNSERLGKLTGNYIVSNQKLKAALGKSLPLSSREGLLKTLESFDKNAE